MKSHIDEQRILISGYPVDSKFETLQLNKTEILKQIGLSANKRIILINAGAQGINLYYNILKEINKNNIQIIFLCGKNEILYNRCQNYIQKMQLESSVKIFSFIDNLQEYLYVCDLVITKAGANSIYESLIMGKPILVEAIEGFLFQERGIQQIIKQYKFGEILNKLDRLNEQLYYMLNKQNLKLYKEQIRLMNIQNGCKKIVSDIVKSEERG